MPKNEITLQERHPLTENLNVLKVGGESSSLEIAQHGSGARISGDLEVGAIYGSDVSVDDLICDSLVINKDLDDTTATTTSALHVDFDRTVDVLSGTDKAIGIDVDVTHAGESSGIIISQGINIDIDGDTTGTSTGYGIFMDISGPDVTYGAYIVNDAGTTSSCHGIYLNNENGGVDFKNVSSALISDYFTLNTIANGETTLTTVDNVGSVAHLNMVADGNFTVDAAVDISLDAAGGDVTILQADLTIPVDKKVIFGNTGEYIIGDDTNLDIVSSGRMTATSTGTYKVESGAAILLDSTTNITLDAGDGTFIASNAGTEFSAVNSAYAGMILGYTEIFDHVVGIGDDSFQLTTTSFVNLSLTQGGGEKYLKVAFVVPPSNKVKITVHLPYCAFIDGTLLLGLATDDSATTLHEDYERTVWDVDESDLVGIVYHWTIEGSDVSWSAGESKTIYAMVKETTAGGRIYAGDTVLINAGGWIMEAVALPATIGDGS